MKKFMFAAMAALVLVSCGGAEAKDSKKDSKKDSQVAEAPATETPATEAPANAQ